MTLKNKEAKNKAEAIQRLNENKEKIRNDSGVFSNKVKSEYFNNRK